MRQKIDRTGEIHYMNDKLRVQIIKSISYVNNTIRYDDDTIKEGVRYGHIIRGSVDKPVYRLGEIHFNVSGLPMKIVKYINSLNVSVIFDNGYTVDNVAYNTIIKGGIKNLYHPPTTVLDT